MSSITNDVAELESLVESLTAENRILHNTKVQNEFELFELRRSQEKMAAERDQALDAAARMKVILDQAGAAIVHGMRQYHATRRLAVNSDQNNEEDPPLFLQKQEEHRMDS
jgi:hypothetical protein